MSAHYQWQRKCSGSDLSYRAKGHPTGFSDFLLSLLFLLLSFLHFFPFFSLLLFPHYIFFLLEFSFVLHTHFNAQVL